MDLEALAATASGQGGAFSTKDVIAAGGTQRLIRAARESGRWHRLYEGAYVDAALWSAMDEEQKALCRLRGRLQVVGDGWHAARGSALLVHGLPYLGRPPAVPRLVRAPTSSSDRAASAWERIAELTEADRAEVAGCAVTALARTVADVSREVPLVNGLVVADAALRGGMSPREFAEVARRCARWPGARALQQVLRLADGLAESPFESLSRGRMHEVGLPAPELQAEIWADGRFVARVDFLWREHNLIGESDGRSKYTTTDEFYAEKIREQSLEDLGFEVVRWDWDTAWGREQDLAAAVRRGLARGRLNTVVPGVRLVAPRAAGRLAA